MRSLPKRRRLPCGLLVVQLKYNVPFLVVPGRVTRFRVETDQATRWLAFALLEVEKGFRRISGYKELPQLMAALERESTEG